VTIAATYSGSSRTATLTVKPLLASVTFNPATVQGGTKPQGTVSLAAPAPVGGVTVALQSSNPSVVTVPSSVTVAAGSASAIFTASTTPVSSLITVTVTATYLSSIQATALTVTATPTSWLGSAWPYRVPISISNPGGATMTNFQVHVLLDSSFPFASAQPSGGDVRFTSGDGVTLLASWTEAWNASQRAASLYVRVASLTANGATMFMYYGNPAAASVSDGNATFNFFDDFSYTSGGTPAIDPSKWSFPLGQAGFSNAGGMLSYNGPFGGFGPTAIAMRGGGAFSFNDGIVEYNLQSNGGFDEMGLEYRGQNQATSSSYVFYPSIWNQQNKWLLYKLAGGAETNLGTGGTFSSGAWYAVKAVIGGSSHAFFVNGTQVLSANDATFSSGSLGLLAWGNSVSWVTNFRVRQYAATEPTAFAGSQQSGP
jgi:hypothetical protein